MPRLDLHSYTMLLCKTSNLDPEKEVRVGQTNLLICVSPVLGSLKSSWEGHNYLCRHHPRTRYKSIPLGLGGDQFAGFERFLVTPDAREM